MIFQPGQSGNPSGRPRGSRNRTTGALRALIDEEAEELIRVLAEAGRSGNVSAAKALLDRILPPARSGFGETELQLNSELPLTAAADAVIQAVSDGALAPSDAVQIGTLLKIRAELTGFAELEQRLAKVETELKEHK
jgi:Family of unknown function (DUF5681)